MKIPVVVVTWNGAQWIGTCLESLLEQDPCPDLVLVDNASRDATVEIAEGLGRLFEHRGGSMTVIRLESNTGFPAGANSGLRKVREIDPTSEAVLLLNQDARLERGCLAAFGEVLRSHPDAGCLGAKNIYPETGRIQHAGGYLERPRMIGLHYGHHQIDHDGLYDEIREVDFVTGSSMLLRQAAVDDTGLFNEVFSPGYYEDVELCERLHHRGWKVLFTPAARVQHHESASFRDEMARLRLAHRNRLLYLIPGLETESDSERFLAAEEEFLEREATFEVRRAINGAALDLLAGLPGNARRRVDSTRSAVAVAAAARRIGVRLRSSCTKLLAQA